MISAPPDITARSETLPAPRLTRLELHGFKSFANKTVFAFEPGITSVIGPNGSGKSNVSDAVRWVLGETSQSALRSKKTEDVIFAGGKGRAPSGMAEVAVTFDNSTGWLPTPFVEVTIARRAFRSGESQYLINGRRVRMKDVHHLTASLGQSHTVVGQGLVDAALSQRAEERRSLFEHAADLTGLRLKATEAERSLNEADANAERLTDLLSEIEPRLRTLGRAARQAREWQGTRDHLTALQRVHYGRLWAEAAARYHAAEDAAGEGEVAVARGQAALEERLVAAETARIAAAEARAMLARHDAHLQSTIDQARQVGHERDLAAERHSALSRRRDDMADTQAGLDEQVAAVTAELASVLDHLTYIVAELDEARATVSAKQHEVSTANRIRGERERRADALSRQLRDGERRAADFSRRRALHEQRRETDMAERERAAAAIRERADRINALTVETTDANTAVDADTAALDALDTRLRDLAERIERADEAATSAQTRVVDIERRRDQARTRLDVLQRLHESGSSLHAGVRATLQATRKGTLHGIRGTLADLITVPAAYDTAIEVALGGHLQDIVTDRWAEAEAAITYLKRANAGRVTFQPLDTVRAGNASRPATAILDRSGVHGIAAELVEAGDDLAAVLSALLGRTLIVADLAIARETLSLLPGGWSVVTLSGEIARSGGSVTGGAAVRESGTLTRGRELRELPKTITDLDRELEQVVSTARQRTAARHALDAERQRIQAERAGVIAGREERQAQRARVTRWLDDLRAEQRDAERRLAATEHAFAERDETLASLVAEEAAHLDRLSALRTDSEALAAELSRESAGLTAAERALADAQRQLATLDERLRAERRREAGLRAQERALADELALRAERAASLDGERVALAAQHERLTREAAALEAQRETDAKRRVPLEEAVRRAERDAHRQAQAVENARAAQLDLERAHGAGGLAVERARGELMTIARRIADDLDIEDPDELLEPSAISDQRSASSDQPPAHEDAEKEIARLKERLRRVGYVGEDVVGEYEREAEHQRFLREQLDDVQQAAASLRGVLADLHGTMRSRFDETFSKVAEAFGETFTTLFGGGSARLVLTEASDEDGRGGGGIDIVAQPPGKRPQSLALLSGGERALTAAALLIAILQVNPTPFCLLDEVDAALDEANVVRFREQLQRLAAGTQVIVITHNRSTIEIADTLYGVSMGDDGVSQILSLRLSEQPSDDGMDVE
ncbi:MAG TPA: chromosome segregation protein SMC [Thermomicrobiales bacterium]|nr:chromosome segregation protein SMC [Thermomicrobiales bacterium]